MLLAAQDGEGGAQMTNEQVRDEAMTLFLAGHETTANALTWTWHLLSQNPAAERQLEAELDAVLGGRLPTLADLPQLTYARQVLTEAVATLELAPRLRCPKCGAETTWSSASRMTLRTAHFHAQWPAWW